MIEQASARLTRRKPGGACLRRSSYHGLARFGATVDHSTMKPPSRRLVRSGVDTLPAGHNLPRHLHRIAYATLVLEGAYEQIGYAGRLRLCAGDLVVQPVLDCHANTMLTRGLTLMRLPWRSDADVGGVWRGLDIDAIRRTAEHDPLAASLAAEEQIGGRKPLAPVRRHWVDALAADLVANPSQRVGAWAQSRDRSREAVSRSFHVHYGVSPSVFRAEVMARAAWLRIVRSDVALAQIAFDLGFADQAHMTRAVRWLTGITPRRWRLRHGDPEAGSCWESAGASWPG
jgi:AraC-like DNA-binding protein